MKKQLGKAVLMLGLSFLLCLPYLTYTYSLTHKAFYWGTSGGSSLFWITTPDKNLGNWHSTDEVLKSDFLESYRPLIAEINSLGQVNGDALYKEKALSNIKHYPLKFVRNWVANMGRLLFNYPYTPDLQTLNTYFYILPNIFLYSFIALSFWAISRNKFRISFEFKCLLLIFFIAFFGSSLLSAFNRMFVVILPFLLIPSVIYFDKYVKIQINREE